MDPDDQREQLTQLLAQLYGQPTKSGMGAFDPMASPYSGERPPPSRHPLNFDDGIDQTQNAPGTNDQMSSFDPFGRTLGAPRFGNGVVLPPSHTLDNKTVPGVDMWQRQPMPYPPRGFR